MDIRRNKAPEVPEASDCRMQTGHQGSQVDFGSSIDLFSLAVSRTHDLYEFLSWMRRKGSPFTCFLKGSWLRGSAKEKSVRAKTWMFVRLCSFGHEQLSTWFLIETMFSVHRA